MGYNNYIIATWNANGLAQRKQELICFLNMQKIDVILISETHFTEKSYINISGYDVHHTRHPDGTAHGGTAVIIKKNIKYNTLCEYQDNHLQATSVQIKDNFGHLTLSAVYCPPKYKLTANEFLDFFLTLGPRFIIGGDLNAKHKQWGSRLNTPRGIQLLKAIEDAHCNALSSGEPTYWPTDMNKIPDILDIFITKGMVQSNIKIKQCLDLSSDHSAIIMIFGAGNIEIYSNPTLTNRHTNWILFQQWINEHVTARVPLKTNADIDNAVKYITESIQKAAWISTPKIKARPIINSYPQFIKEKIAQKRRLRRIWQNNRNPENKNKLNNATQKLKRMLREYNTTSFKNYLNNISPFEINEHSLWKATKRLKRPKQHIPPIKNATNWAKTDLEKAECFAQYLIKVFQPFTTSDENAQKNIEEEDIEKYLDAPLQMHPQIDPFTSKNVKNIFKNIHPNKTPGFDLITGKILQNLPQKMISLITSTYNAILRLGHFPQSWKYSQIILILKPGKPPNETTSYRPISLLPILSKAFEKLFLFRLQPKLEEYIPEHQFGFRTKHSTTEQIHRVVDVISKCLEEKKYCSAAFLDLTQAFDKVWHTGLLYKLKKNLEYPYYVLIKSYLKDRYFQVKHNNDLSSFYSIQSGVPQGSVLGPVLYVLYTHDLPTAQETVTATFADDTSILASDDDPVKASRHLQIHLNKVQSWINTWKMKVNGSKSSHITFTMRRKTCPAVQMNGEDLPQTETVRYLGVHLDRRLTWKKHIICKGKELQIKFRKFYWLIGRNSVLAIDNKLLIYKSFFKPIWTYCIQLWGTSSKSNIKIIQRFQSKVLRHIANAPWYVRNDTLHQDFKISTVEEAIKIFSCKYITKLENHTNTLAINLLDNSLDIRRLKKFKPLDLPYRF